MIRLHRCRLLHTSLQTFKQFQRIFDRFARASFPHPEIFSCFRDFLFQLVANRKFVVVGGNKCERLSFTSADNDTFCMRQIEILAQVSAKFTWTNYHHNTNDLIFNCKCIDSQRKKQTNRYIILYIEGNYFVAPLVVQPILLRLFFSAVLSLLK